MPRQYQPVEYNTFVGGLVTEASPLTFPQNASLDEENFVLNKDGSRSRRLGMGFEAGYQMVNPDQPLVDGNLVTSSFKWSNAGGLSTNTIICVQIGSSIDFFLGNSYPISPTKFFTYTFDDLDTIVKFSYTVVDGKLVVASGSKDIHVFTYDTTKAPATAISVETKRLLIRDLFGLDDIDGLGHDLRQGNQISLRPKVAQTSGAHIYNLRNQGWAVPRSPWQGDDHVRDTIVAFRNQDDQGRYPSNADNVAAYITANTDNHGGTKTIMRFDVENMVVQPPVNTYSPIGYFIIDALDRGDSRIKAIQDMQSKYPMNDGDLANAAITSVRADTTPSGATCICEYAGRVWYAGFSGEVIAGDSHSPKMNSYILFSQLVTDSAGINLCYQAADPTDPDGSDLVDTDGGFLRIEGAYGIVGMAVLQSTLFVLAQNGVWTVSGGSGGGFTATNYQTSMLTSAGCMSAGSIVVMQDSIFYWGLDGIYSITRNEFGDFSSKNITDKTIKSFYMSIPNKSIQNAEGVYDSYDTAVKWVFNNYIGAPDDVIELNLDVVTGAYYKHRIKPLQDGFPLLIRGIQTDPYRIEVSDTDVVVGSDDVIVTNGSQVVTSSVSVTNGVKEMVYFILTRANEGFQYTFGTYSEPYHYDWKDVDGIGIDAPAYLLTGYLSGGDYQRNKQVVYMTAHFKRTETVPPLTLVGRDYLTGFVNLPYSDEAWSAQYGSAPYTWSFSEGLPPGINQDSSSSSKLVGTPTTAGTYTFNVTVRDAAGATATEQTHLVVSNPPPIAVMSCPNTPDDSGDGVITVVLGSLLAPRTSSETSYGAYQTLFKFSPVDPNGDVVKIQSSDDGKYILVGYHDQIQPAGWVDNGDFLRDLPLSMNLKLFVKEDGSDTWNPSLEITLPEDVVGQSLFQFGMVNPNLIYGLFADNTTGLLTSLVAWSRADDHEEWSSTTSPADELGLDPTVGINGIRYTDKYWAAYSSLLPSVALPSGKKNLIVGASVDSRINDGVVGPGSKGLFVICPDLNTVVTIEPELATVDVKYTVIVDAKFHPINPYILAVVSFQDKYPAPSSDDPNNYRTVIDIYDLSSGSPVRIDRKVQSGGGPPQYGAFFTPDGQYLSAGTVQVMDPNPAFYTELFRVGVDYKLSSLGGNEDFSFITGLGTYYTVLLGTNKVFISRSNDFIVNGGNTIDGSTITRDPAPLVYFPNQSTQLGFPVYYAGYFPAHS